MLYEQTGDLNAAVLDYVHGREDLASGVVRAIGDPKLRFAEDKLRMLRAVRFAARLGYQIDEATAGAIHCQAAEIAWVSQERIRDELTRILTEGSARRGFELLYPLGLLASDPARSSAPARRRPAAPVSPRGRCVGAHHAAAGEASAWLLKRRWPGARCCTTSASRLPTNLPIRRFPAIASTSTATLRWVCAWRRSSWGGCASPTRMQRRSLRW